MKSCLSFLWVLISLLACGQSSKPTEKNEVRVGGRCEGCEAIYESPVSFDKLNWQDTLADYNENGPKLHVSGTVYKSNGATPAPGVVLYFYHTDQTGVYPKKGNEKGWAQRHGFLRGWVKTNEKGQYAFYTLKPVSYPKSTEPAHIHFIVKEPGKNEYYIDDIVFDDDPFLSGTHRQRFQNKGGSGILKPLKQNGIFIARRDVVLGKNIEDYN